MNLTDEQKQRIVAWIQEGLNIAGVQKRIETEFNLRPTYLETRLLVDDLKLVPKDPEPPKTASPLLEKGTSKPETAKPGEVEEPEEPASPGGVSVTVDTVARPGALMSGKVNFSDGQKAEWLMDQMGRLGLVPQQQGYRPSQADMQAFQVKLEAELQKFGF
jgi:hypothetical protein